MAKTEKMAFDTEQKKRLSVCALEVITQFKKGVVQRNDDKPHDWGENGATYFESYGVRFTDDYLRATSDFTRLAAKMLKAKSAHESTIRTMCRNAGQDYVKDCAELENETSESLKKAAGKLVDTVLAEAGREYVHIEPNFLVRHTVPDVISLGRVRSMQTSLAIASTRLSENNRIILQVGNYPEQSFHDGVWTIQMPANVWVVDVPATKENVVEEAKWLIDVAISLMRLSTQKWSAIFPSIGKTETHPTRPPTFSNPHVTLDGNHAYAGGGTLPGFYEINAETAADLKSPLVQSRSNTLFNASENSLALRFAQGLGWMTRGRQESDRAERLLSFFTSLEALLTSTDKNDPVTQTISRHVSVIFTQDVKKRISVYNHIKSLYALRSDVVHKGRREVLWQEADSLQLYVETVFWTVLQNCDLSMKQDIFAQSLIDASHGLPWKFSSQMRASDIES